MQQFEIPMIDFAPLTIGDQAAKRQVAAQIEQACQTCGFFYLSQPNLSAHLVEQTFAQAKAFFDLPTVVKQQVLRSPQTNCGYIPLAAESLNPARPADWKEALNIGLETVWLPELSQFRATVWPFYQLCIAQVAVPILQTLALALDLPESFLVERHGQNFFLRLLHYPPVPEGLHANQLRAGEHTDYGTITLLFQKAEGELEISTGSCLEICTRQNNWISVPALAGTIVVNVGDALQRWTNDRFRSTPHRVVLPDLQGRSRYSIALFCDPDPNVEIACFPTCQRPDQPPLYPPIRFQDYLQSRFATTY